ETSETQNDTVVKDFERVAPWLSRSLLCFCVESLVAQPRVEIMYLEDVVAPPVAPRPGSFHKHFVDPRDKGVFGQLPFESPAQSGLGVVHRSDQAVPLVLRRDGLILADLVEQIEHRQKNRIDRLSKLGSHVSRGTAKRANCSAARLPRAVT